MLLQVCVLDIWIFFQVARAGRFGTKGLAITFVSEESDATTLNSVQDRFEVNVSELPDELDVTTYSKWRAHSWGMYSTCTKCVCYNIAAK